MRTGANSRRWGALFLAVALMAAPVGAVTLDSNVENRSNALGVRSTEVPRTIHQDFVYSRLDARPKTTAGEYNVGSASRLRALFEQVLSNETPSAGNGESDPAGATRQVAPKTPPAAPDLATSPAISAEATFNENERLNGHYFGSGHHFGDDGALANWGWATPGGKPVRSSQNLLLALQYTNFPDPPQPLVPIPEPATITLMLLGFSGMVYRGRRGS